MNVSKAKKESGVETVIPVPISPVYRLDRSHREAQDYSGDQVSGRQLQKIPSST